MVLAIDAGNTALKVGAWDGHRFTGVFRRPADPTATAAEIEDWLWARLADLEIPRTFSAAVCCSVVPQLEDSLAALDLGTPLRFLRSAAQVEMQSHYEPPASLGADRLANVVGASVEAKPPFVVVDLGTATKLDAVDSSGTYRGGAILPGLEMSAKMLAEGTAQLPKIPIQLPSAAIGRSTLECLQSGIVLGHVSAVAGLVRLFARELGEKPTVLSTGGLASMFPAFEGFTVRSFPDLTLRGLVAFSERG